MDPEIQDPTEFQYYVTLHGIHSDWSKRSHEQLIGDVNVLHDFTRKLVREKDLINKRLATTLDRLNWEQIWRRILTAAVITQGAMIGWLFRELLPFMVKR